MIKNTNTNEIYKKNAGLLPPLDVAGFKRNLACWNVQKPSLCFNSYQAIPNFTNRMRFHSEELERKSSWSDVRRIGIGAIGFEQFQ